MSKNKKIIKKVIELEKIQKAYSRYHCVQSYSSEKGCYCEAEYNPEMYDKIESQIKELCDVLVPQMRNRSRYNIRLAHNKVIGLIYKSYNKIFQHTWKSGGPLTIIGKVDHKHNNNCEYPNTPYYRLTKAWKWV